MIAGSRLMKGALFTAAAGLTGYGLTAHFQKQALYASSSSSASSSTPLSPDQFKPFRLQSVETLTPNTKRFRFEVGANVPLGLPIASAVLAKHQPEGAAEPVIRPYTPTSPSDAVGYFEFVIKVYEGGKMSSHIFNLKPGDTLSLKGPLPKIKISPNFKKEIGMVAGGTGITPMYQVIQEILKYNDGTQMTLIFGNRTEDDIILRNELDNLAAKHKNFKVHYVIEKADSYWKGTTGFITKDLLKSQLPKPSKDSVVLVCGPPPMMKVISGEKAPDFSQGKLSGYLSELGYTEENVFKF